jgi:HEAT repeat protein
MTKPKLIPFDRKKRLIRKARVYLEAEDRYQKEQDVAVDRLLRAFEVADADLQLRILALLGTVPSDRVAAACVKWLADQALREEVRQQIAVQLSLILPCLAQSQQHNRRLIALLGEKDPDVRLYAAYALGWSKNHEALVPLGACLADDDLQVQVAAVDALVNLELSGAFAFLKERLRRASQVQARSILLNLWRFSAKSAQVLATYRLYLKDSDPDIRLEVLAVLDKVATEVELLIRYRGALKDHDVRIRNLALSRLQILPPNRLQALVPDIRPLTNDPEKTIRAAARQLLALLP